MDSSSMVVLATVPAVLALVQLAKNFGVTGKWSMLLSVGLGVALSVLDYLTNGIAASENLYSAAVTGLLVGLSAAGLYDGTRKVATPQEQDDQNNGPNPRL